MISAGERAAPDPDRVIFDLPLSSRCINALGRAGLWSVDQLLERSEPEVGAISGLGPGCLRELVDCLFAEGMRLRSGSAPAPGPSARSTLHPRLQDMRAMRLAGATLKDIGDKHGVSRERVRQLLEPFAVAGEDVRAARAAVAAEVAANSADLIVDRWRCGHTVENVAREAGITVRACTAIIEDRATELDAAARRKAQNVRSRAAAKRYSDENLLSAIRRVARMLGRAPSRNDYDLIADELGLPSGVLITNRLGWSHAVRAAGLTPLPARRSYSRRWTQESCLTALYGVVAQLGRIPSYQEYDRLRAGKTDLPSGPTVRNRVGGWAEVRSRLAHMTSR